MRFLEQRIMTLLVRYLLTFLRNPAAQGPVESTTSAGNPETEIGLTFGKLASDARLQPVCLLNTWR
ncbi:hypothetical protein ALQ30_200458 [Pseudomonas syringae pv. persicae]|nr:hypothetical protein ALQ30_200458 [Pseudomonas syringae pv. persicae]